MGRVLCNIDKQAASTSVENCRRGGTADSDRASVLDDLRPARSH